VVRRVDLLHLNLGVDVAVSQEVDVSVFHLKMCLIEIKI
jgi:hypothetical protein